jgi:hypothetical protein
MTRAGLVRAEGQTVTSASATDKIVIQKLDSSSGQYEPREISVANLITGGGTGLTEASVVFINSSGDLAQDNPAFIYTAATDTLRVTNIDLGLSATAGSLDIFPTTASKGKLTITAADSAGDTTTAIVNASQAGARTYTIPDAGASASFVMTAGAQTLAGVKTFTSDITASSANIIAATAGKGLQIKEGTNARMGVATLSSGTVTVSNTSVTANTRIILGRYSPGSSTALGILSVGTVSASTSFVINALKEADATVQTNDVSVVDWILVEAAA